jgi:energy-coupling factor transporter ATP-binding protein EcfA2
MFFSRIVTGGLRGHRHTIELYQLTTITGPNGSGKSTALDALVLATQQRLPGQPVDREGMVPPSVLDECCDSSGSIAVEAQDSEGGVVSFSYTRGGRRQVAATFATGTQAEVRAAIKARYGELIAALDASRVLDSAAVAQWLGEALAAQSADYEELRQRVLQVGLAAMKKETTRVLSTQEIGAALAWKTDPGDGAQTHLARAAEVCAAKLTAARSAVRQAGEVLRSQAPQQPTAEQVAEARQLADEARAQFEAALGARHSYESALQGDAAGTVTRELASARADLGRLEVAVREAEAKYRAEEAELRRLDAELHSLETTPAVFNAQKAYEREAARVDEARAVLATAQAVYQQMQAPDVLRLELEAQQAKLRDVREFAQAAVTRLADASARAAALSWDGHGACPTCGSEGGEAIASLQARYDEARGELEWAQSAHTDALDSLAKRQAQVQAVADLIRVREDSDRHLAGVQAGVERAQAAAEHAQRQVELEARRVDAAMSDAKAKTKAIEAQLERLAAVLADARAKLANARQRVSGLESQLRGPEETGRARLEELKRAERLARAAEATAADTVAKLEGQVRAAAEHAQRLGEAEQARILGQAWTDAWTCLSDAVGSVAGQVLAEQWAPFVQPVSQLAQDFEVGLGQFCVLTDGAVRMGWQTPRGFAPFSQLSHGNRLLTAVLIGAAAHLLLGTEGAPRVLAVDAAEALDVAAEATFSSLTSWLIEEGHLDQVLVGSVVSPALGAECALDAPDRGAALAREAA